MPGIIRQANAADVSAIFRLYAQMHLEAGMADPGLEDLRKAGEVVEQISRANGHDLLVFEQGGKIIGTMALVIASSLSHGSRPWAVIEHLVIDKGYRNKGLGKRLVEYGIERARQAGCYKLSLGSDMRRTGAHEFYRKLGFEKSAYNFRMYFGC